jgi:lysophospholipid acyltransferase (LPLAT)-like uncharacterized protein
MEGLVGASRRVLGWIAAWVARIWVLTLRVRVHGAQVLSACEEGPRVLAFFHGTQLMLHGLPRERRTCVMVSHSRDGDVQASALATLGFDVVRGSSSRGGTRALATIVRRLRQPRTDAVFAVDGPRGPQGVVKRGALMAAARAGARVIPVGASARRRFVLDRAWDQFVLPWPFTRVDIVLGEPIEPGEDAALRLAHAIDACNDAAQGLTG